MGCVYIPAMSRCPQFIYHPSIQHPPHIQAGSALKKEGAEKAVSTRRKNKTTNDYLGLCRGLDIWLVCCTSDRNQATTSSDFKLCRSTQPRIKTSDSQENSCKVKQRFFFIAIKKNLKAQQRIYRSETHTDTHRAHFLVLMCQRTAGRGDSR